MRSYPFEHPGIGPNTFRFDDRVAYDIHVSLDNDDIAKGKTDLTYRFRFKTVFAPDTILSFGGLVQPAARVYSLPIKTCARPIR